MSLKQLIKQRTILNKVIARPLEIPGEPMIYSVKYPVGQRTHHVNYFRNMQWKSLFKAQFRAFHNTNIPVVLILRFFVSPPSGMVVSRKDLSKESLPAVKGYELVDYVLSFEEMLLYVLINSYKQIVKLDCIKFYSSNPRTEVKFMLWDEYVKLQSDNTNDPKTKSLRKKQSGNVLQPKRKGNGSISKVRTGEVLRKAHAATEGTAACDSALCDASTSKPARTKQKSSTPLAPHEEARRGQPGEIP